MNFTIKEAFTIYKILENTDTIHNHKLRFIFKYFSNDSVNGG